ncbi:helix-turn-helix domain-containing protein [Acinetobacter sp. A47]|uniref:helix-turn-helix domain-containing protein n=1 Tax=Acinetobacter sp. A47 TaxID=1561217 RepID=UPI0005718B65|nr:XRE family transcriptional regulator [Acinetobacter sp. A47]
MSQTDAVLEHVGKNIRHFRDLRQLSQQQLADRAGVSRRTIAALETGQVNISLAKLDAIAAVLGIDFRRMVSAPELGAAAVVNSLAWQGQNPDSHATLLASVPVSTQVELWTWSLAVGEVYHAEADQQGWRELIYVLEGELTLEFAQETRVVQAGDTILFESSVRYAYANRGIQPLKFMRHVLY